MERLFRVYGVNIRWFSAMLRDERSENAAGKASELERNYDWLGATEFCKKALDLVCERDFPRMGKIQERIAYDFYRAAFQAESADEFRGRMHQAVAGYEKAREFYGKANGQGERPGTVRCDAMMAYMNYWLVSDASEKKKLLDACWSLTKETLMAFKQSENTLEYGKTYSQLSAVAYHSFSLEWSFQTRMKVVGDAVEYGEQAINLLSGVANSHELAESYAKTALYLTIFANYFISGLDEKEKYRQKSLKLWQEALKLSEETALLELLGIFSEFETIFQFNKLPDLLKKALRYAQKTKDRYLTGSALDQLAYATFVTVSEDPEKILQTSQEALKYAEDAKSSYSAISFVSPRAGILWTAVPGIEYYTKLATNVETDPKKKRSLLEKAIEEGTYAIELSKNTGYPETIKYANFTLSGALRQLGRLETNLDEKKALLERALAHSKEALVLAERLEPHFYWNVGFHWNGMGQLKGELSAFEKNFEKRKTILEEAISDKEYGSQLFIKNLQLFEKTGGETTVWWAQVAISQYSRGGLLNSLYELTRNEQHQRRAIKAFEEAVNSFQKANRVTRIAECYWKAAQTYDALEEHLESAKNFESASKNYRLAAEKIPVLKGFYSDYALYMRAWIELERSRQGHENEDYAKSREHCRRCSRFLETTEKWSYLSPYYFAWSLLEHGEALSRLDKPQDAMEAFHDAVRTFGKAANGLGKKAEELENSEERDEGFKLTNLARLRRQYCMGRILMEKAKLCNEKGDRISSAKKYVSAGKIFKEIAPNMETKEAREELRFAAITCAAWEKMELAEEGGNAALYKKAAELFAKAGRISPRNKAGFAAIGSSCFCEALELGTKFMAASSTDFYSRAKSRMEDAAGFYLRAGFEKTALWVEAAKRFLDAYAYVGKAEAEAEPEKRGKSYLMAEKCLALSAKFYGTAGYHRKKNEVLQSLKRARKERKLALSLAKILTAPTALSSATGISMPDSTEKAVGLNDFESVNIRARVSVPEEFIPGKEFEVKLDLVNVGKKPGLLLRIEGLVPLRCEVLRVPSCCVLEGGSLNMRGKRVDPLSVESVSIWVQIADVVGVSLSPQIVYADELGNFRTLRAEEVKIRAVVEFEHKVTQLVFDYLVNAFVEDCVKRRLGVEKSGWRSLPQIIKGACVSKRSLYGSGGRLGLGLSELQRNGLVDLETILGERGRGGSILRVRIHYQKELVRRYVKEKAPDLLT